MTANRHTSLSLPQGGFTLIEVLVALIIVSIGLLGLAGLQSTSLKLTQGSYFRSLASQRADEISERIRTNYKGFEDAAYYGIWGTPSALPANMGCNQVFPGGTQTPPASGCTTGNMAKDDAFIWQKNNTILLPSGFGVVCLDSTPEDGTPTAPACSGDGSRVVVKIWWDESRAGGSATQRFVTIFQP